MIISQLDVSLLVSIKLSSTSCSTLLGKGRGRSIPAPDLYKYSHINAYLGGASEEKANEAAGKAFVSAVDTNPSFKMDSHCGKAAQAFMANF